MSNPEISYSIGLPVYIEIDGNGKLTVSVDLAEAGDDIQFGYGGALLGDDEVTDGYDEATYARIEAAMQRVNYEVVVTV